MRSAMLALVLALASGGCFPTAVVDNAPPERLKPQLEPVSRSAVEKLPTKEVKAFTTASRDNVKTGKAVTGARVSSALKWWALVAALLAALLGGMGFMAAKLGGFWAKLFKYQEFLYLGAGGLGAVAILLYVGGTVYIWLDTILLVGAIVGGLYLLETFHTQATALVKKVLRRK